VLYVNHAPNEAARLADHIVVLEAGRVVAAGPLAETLARADLPIRLGEDAGVVLDATVAEIDNAWHLARVEFPGGCLWVRDGGHAVGKRLRVRVLARDVSLAREEPTGSSILNHIFRSRSAACQPRGARANPAVASGRKAVRHADQLARRLTASLVPEPRFRFGIVLGRRWQPRRYQRRPANLVTRWEVLQKKANYSRSVRDGGMENRC